MNRLPNLQIRSNAHRSGGINDRIIALKHLRGSFGAYR